MERPTVKRIEEWRAAGIIDDATAERIRAWEAGHAPAHGSRLGRFAFGFGGLLLGAGILLFVAANWYVLSPWGRFATIAATVALLHVAASVARPRSTALATTLHAVGTAAFGGGVFLAGQTFNLAEQWPSGFLLWSVGAACALWLLRDWPHVLWVAVLGPLWLTAQWYAQGFAFTGLFGPYALPAVGLLVLSVAYLSAIAGDRDATWRRALSRLGAVVLVPMGAALPFVQLGARTGFPLDFQPPAPSTTLLAIGWTAALALPLLVGWWLRGREAWPLLVVTVFAVIVGALDTSTTATRVTAHLLYFAACAGLVWWGLRDAHRLRVNVGVLGFALTVLSFYYSSVFDKFGRALGLIGLGVLFIGGGWWLERTRRQLLGRIEGGSR
jgi:uncharacterized membrane protein